MSTASVVRAPLTIRCTRLDVSVLTTTGKQVLIAMASHADSDGSNCYPSTARIARETGLHRVTVTEAIKHLRGIGALTPIGDYQASLKQARASRQALEYRVTIDHVPATSHPLPARRSCSPGLQGHVAQDYKGMQPRTTSPDQKTGSEDRGEEKAPTPPAIETTMEAKAETKREPEQRPKADANGRFRTLCARLGFSTRPDALEDLASWLKGQGFRSWSLIEDFLADSARAILPICQEARAKGLYLRHVRPHLDAWRYVEEIREDEASLFPAQLTPAMSSTCFRP